MNFKKWVKAGYNSARMVVYSLVVELVDIVELVSKELNHFGVFADLFRQVGGHSTGFVLFCSF